MNASARPVVAPQEGMLTRLRSFVIGLTFATVLLIPRVLRLRQNSRTWKAVRVLMAVAGATLVIVPLSIASSWMAAVVGLMIFVAAILLPPAKPASDVAEKAKELGALAVVNGGEYEPPNESPVSVQLFVGSEHILALDSRLDPFLDIPVTAISSAIAAEAEGHWILRVRWMERTSDFIYCGVFAEHLARVAESTICGVLRSPLRVLQQTQSARA